MHYLLPLMKHLPMAHVTMVTADNKYKTLVAVMATNGMVTHGSLCTTVPQSINIILLTFVTFS